MPGAYHGPDLMATIAAMGRRIQQIASQQQFVISNLEGEPVVAGGRIPGSNPAAYGMQLLDPTTHQPLAFFGEQSGNAGLSYYDSSGNLLRVDNGSGTTWYNSAGYVIREDNASGTMWYDGTSAQILRTKIDTDGIHVYDATGTTQEVGVGLLSNGDYGLEVTDASGQSNEIRPLYISGTGNVTSTTSTTPVAVPGTSVTATIGATGNAFVTMVGVGGMNGPATSGGNAYFAVGIDGVAPSGLWSELQTNLDAAQITAPVSVSRMITGLSAGSHTFQSYVWSDSTGHSVALDLVYTIVEPR